MCENPLCTLVDLKTGLTIDDLADLHEVLNLRELSNKKQADQNKKNKK